MSLERIAAAFGTSARTLTLHAKKEGWVRLVVGTKRLRPGRKPRAPGEPKPKRATVDEVRRRDMVRRLLEALDKRLTLLETRMAPEPKAAELRKAPPTPSATLAL
jgi:hypothetical protein